MDENLEDSESANVKIHFNLQNIISSDKLTTTTSTTTIKKATRAITIVKRVK